MNNSLVRGDVRIGLRLPRGIELLERVGEGAMAQVYRAIQRPLGRNVAVKVIASDSENAAAMSERVLREASVASTLNHPNSIDIYDYGKTEDGLTYLVMEFLRGKDLATLLSTHGPLGVERAVHLMLQVLSALDEAHSLGIVHRDVKPENVFVEQRRRLGDFVKLVDFGLAKYIKSKGQQITEPNLVSGTPEYMAPEQARGDAVDGRADLYCVAVILFEMLGGKRPFEGESPMDVMLMQIGRPAPRLDTSGDLGIPPALVDIVQGGMEKRPENRFQSAREMALALEQVLEERRSVLPVKRVCRACGAQELQGRFCGVCGAASTPASAPNATTRRAVPALVGRNAEREWVRAPRRSAMEGQFVAVELLGRPGVGKTALLEAIAEEFRNLGDYVVMSGPDEFGGLVSGSGFRQIISALSDGVAPQDLATSDAARSNALRKAMGLNAQGLEGGCVVVIVDDVDEIDALTRRALQDVVDAPPEGGLLLLVAAKNRTLRLPGRVQVKEIAPLSNEWARQLVSAEALAMWPESSSFTPLALKHLDGYTSEGGDNAPTSLPELIAQRITRTDPAAKRLLQLLATARRPIPLAQLTEQNEPDAASAFERLERRGLVRSGKDGMFIPHRLMEEVVRSAVPVGMRRAVEARVLEVLTELGAPLDARAWAARRAEAVVLGILLLEQVAVRSDRWGDPALAAEAYQGITELCRADVGRGELDDPLAMEARYVLRWAGALRALSRNSEANAVLAETTARLPPHKARALRQALGNSVTEPALPRGMRPAQRSNA